MEWNEAKLQENIRRADTDDLLDRITAYRAGLEPEAIDMIEQELRRRGVSATQIAAQGEQVERECIFHEAGLAKTCSFCRQPAVYEGWGWHKLFGLAPLFPRRLRYCKKHHPGLG